MALAEKEIKDYSPPEGFKEELKRHLDVLKSYYLNSGPMPVNSKVILKFLQEILDYEDTNSFYYASSVAKTIALAYVLILLSHTADYPQHTGFLINDPQSLEHLEPDGSAIKELIEFVKKSLDMFEVK